MSTPTGHYDLNHVYQWPDIYHKPRKQQKIPNRVSLALEKKGGRTFVGVFGVDGALKDGFSFWTDDKKNLRVQIIKNTRQDKQFTQPLLGGAYPITDEGYFIEGKTGDEGAINCYGKMKDTNSDTIFQGIFIGGKPNTGRGRLTYKSQDTFEGVLRNGRRWEGTGLIKGQHYSWKKGEKTFTHFQSFISTPTMNSPVERPALDGSELWEGVD